MYMYIPCVDSKLFKKVIIQIKIALLPGFHFLKKFPPISNPDTHLFLEIKFELSTCIIDLYIFDQSVSIS